jgi:MFS family permease
VCAVSVKKCQIVEISNESRLPSTLAFSVFVVIFALNFFRIGYQLVVIAWLAVQFTGSTGAVGYVLLISTLVSFIFSPVMGKLVDGFKSKRRLVIFGHIGLALSGIIPLTGGVFLPAESHFSILIATLVFATVFAMPASGAMDYFTKSYIQEAMRIQKLASLNIVMQIALIVGTGVGGIAVSALSFSMVFLIVSACGLVTAFLCRCLLPRLTVPNEGIARSRKWFLSAGPLMYFEYPSLFSVACCAALVFSVGQITNTLLPALIDIYLHRTSVSYSLMEAAWSIGAFCISAIFIRKIKKSVGQNTQDLVLIALMACLLAIIPQLKSFNALLTAHLVLGASFAFVRIRSETRFLTICPMGLLGRFRANSSCLTSLIGLIVFSMPLIFSHLSIPELYVLLAGMVLASVTAIFLFEKIRHSSG